MPILLGYLAKPLAIVALIAALAGYRAWLIHQRDAARAEVQTLQGQVSELTAANQAMKQAVGQQNAAVSAMAAQASAAGQQAEAKAAAAAQRGAEMMQQQIRQARTLTRAAVPAGCAGAIAWGNAQGPELGRW
jgi:hypothetical protein